MTQKSLAAAFAITQEASCEQVNLSVGKLPNKGFLQFLFLCIEKQSFSGCCAVFVSREILFY